MSGVRFPVKFMSIAATIGLAHTIIFFVSVTADPMLEPVLENWTDYPFPSYFMGVILLSPLVGISLALWYQYRPTTFDKMRHLSIGRLSLLVGGVFVGNLIVIFLLANTPEQWDSVMDRIFRHHATALNSPLVMLPLVLLAALGFAWVFKEHIAQPPEVDRRVVYGMSCGILGAVVLQLVNVAVGGPFPLPF